MTPPAEGQEKDVLLVLDKQQGKVSAVKGFDKESNLQTVPPIQGGEFMQVVRNGSIITKDTYSDFFLHVEFRVPEDKATNGGVYLLSLYELNIKDGFSQEKGASCGAFGNVSAPAYPDPEYNWSLPPMVWQTMDISFTAPRFDTDGKKISNARVSMSLNGHEVTRTPKSRSSRVRRAGSPSSRKGPYIFRSTEPRTSSGTSG